MLWGGERPGAGAFWAFWGGGRPGVGAFCAFWGGGRPGAGAFWAFWGGGVQDLGLHRPRTVLWARLGRPCYRRDGGDRGYR